MIRSLVILAFLATASAAPQIRSVPTLDGRIVGGENANIENYPYTASLQMLSSHTCGAAIISPTWLLTAAHCVDTAILIPLMNVRVGSTTRGSGGQVLSILRVIRHASYNRQNIDYDIAALELASPITVANALAVPLPVTTASPLAGEISVITGWGSLTEGGTSPTILQVVEVPIVSQASCRSAYGTTAVTDRMFCAGILGVGGKDACQGDSGGPVIVRGVLVGLVSWGIGCARPDYPGVYTNVPNLRQWVLTTTGL